jgi:hypothetical protein
MADIIIMQSCPALDVHGQKIPDNLRKLADVAINNHTSVQEPLWGWSHENCHSFELSTNNEMLTFQTTTGLHTPFHSWAQNVGPCTVKVGRCSSCKNDDIIYDPRSEGPLCRGCGNAKQREAKNPPNRIASGTP